MGTTLTGLTPATTYDALIKVGDNGPITGALKVLSDGLGTNLPMEASTTAINFTGTAQVGGVGIANTTQVAAKQDLLVSGTNIKTINSTSLLGSGNIAVVTSPSGVAGAIQFSNGSAFASDASNLFWDDTNNRLGVGTNAPTATTHIVGANSVISGFALKVFNSSGQGSLSVTNDGVVQVGDIAGLGYPSILAIMRNSGTQRGTTFTQYGNNLFIQNFFGGVTYQNTPITIVGSGSTSATTSLLVQNSAGTSALKVTDDGNVSLNKISSLDGSGVVQMPIYLQSQSGNFVFKNSGSSDLLLLNSSVASFLGTIAFNNSSPSASACVDLTSTTKGFLPPRMTTTQKNAIATPSSGLVVYDSTTNKLCCYNGSTWNDLF